MALVAPVYVGVVFFFRLLNLLFGAVGGLSQTQMRPLFAYSSISHMGWILSLVAVSMVGVMRYLGVYMMILVPLVWVMSVFRGMRVKVLRVIVRYRRVTFFMFGVMLLRLGGMPPFSGFFMKAFSVYLLVDGGFALMRLLFVVCATLRLAYYINVLFLGVLSGRLVGIRRVKNEISSLHIIFRSLRLIGFPILVRVMI